MYPINRPVRFDPNDTDRMAAREASRREAKRWDGRIDETRRFHAAMFNLTKQAEFDAKWEAATGKSAKETDAYLAQANKRIAAKRSHRKQKELA